MDLSGLAAFGANVYPGFMKGQAGIEDLALKRQQVLAAQQRNQQVADEQQSLSFLADAFGVAFPNQTPPQAPGQPSVPKATDQDQGDTSQSQGQPAAATTSAGQPTGSLRGHPRGPCGCAVSPWS